VLFLTEHVSRGMFTTHIGNLNVLEGKCKGKIFPVLN